MILEAEILKTYFDITFCEKKCDVKFSLKKHFKKDSSPKRSDGRPYSGACAEYYIHHIGDDAERVYAVRKKLLTPIKRLTFALQYFEEDYIRLALIKKLTGIRQRVKQKFEDPNWVESWKSKLKEAVTDEKRAVLSKNAKNNWSSEVYRQKQTTPKRKRQKSANMRNLWNDKGFREKWIAAIQSEARREKIRQSSIAKWKHAREENPELYYRMSHSSVNKHFSIQEKPATSIEHKMSLILEELGYTFVFDSPITCQGETYRPDFFIPKLNLVVECYGDYWHANPKLYEDSAPIFRGISAKDIRARDEQRKSFYCRNGYNFVYFFQSDMDKETINKTIKDYEFPE